jgi:hypothetical protein
MAPSNELKQILGEIEERAKTASERFNILTSAELKESVCYDNPALVKALRESRRRFLVEVGPETQFEVMEYDDALTAILNQGRDDKKELGEKDAS